jgi:hypothetical protein
LQKLPAKIREVRLVASFIEQARPEVAGRINPKRQTRHVDRLPPDTKSGFEEDRQLEWTHRNQPMALSQSNSVLIVGRHVLQNTS